MSVRVRPFRNGGMEVDIAVLLPDGTRYRERKVHKKGKSVVQRGQGAYRPCSPTGLPDAQT